jgi:hypothetical protein
MENSVVSYFFFFLLAFVILFFSGCLTGNRDILFLPSIDKNGLTQTLFVTDKTILSVCYIDVNAGLITKSNCT